MPTRTEHRYTTIPRVLCFLRRGERWLLIRRAPDRRLWPNLYNGLGGHVEESEGILAAARREVWEEAGIEALGLSLCGIIHADEGGRGVVVFVFTGSAGPGELCPSPEGTPGWFTTAEALQLDLLPDVRLILPRLLSRQPCDPPFFAQTTLDATGKPLLAFES